MGGGNERDVERAGAYTYTCVAYRAQIMILGSEDNNRRDADGETIAEPLRGRFVQHKHRPWRIRRREDAARCQKQGMSNTTTSSLPYARPALYQASPHRPTTTNHHPLLLSRNLLCLSHRLYRSKMLRGVHSTLSTRLICTALRRPLPRRRRT